MAKYRKPAVIEAFRWTGGPDQTEDPEWIVEMIENGNVTFESRGVDLSNEPTTTEATILVIHTLEGDMRADPGDWIIRDKGKVYPMKEHIFLETYEPAD